MKTSNLKELATLLSHSYQVIIGVNSLKANNELATFSEVRTEVETLQALQYPVASDDDDIIINEPAQGYSDSNADANTAATIPTKISDCQS